MTDIIKPPHAISIWATKEILYVELPKADGSGGQGHTLQLPLNVFGLTQCINLLKARQVSSRLGEKGDPTQFQSEKAIAEMSRKAAGYTGPIKKEIKIPLTEKLKLDVKSVIRRFVRT